MRLNFVGDIMLGRKVNDSLKTHGVEFVLNKIKEILPNADKTIANLEAPYITNGSPAYNKESHLTFKIDPELITVLDYLKISAVSLANNHITDYGKEGFESTIHTLNNANIAYTGVGANLKEAIRPIICKDSNSNQSIGIFAFNAFVPFTSSANQKKFGSARFDRISVDYAMKIYRSSFDGIIFIVHWGIDYDPFPIPQLINFAKCIIDDYPEIIAFVGHHPHMIQPIINYNGKPIFCSLGNFIFDEPFPLSRIGCILTLEINNNHVVDHSFIYTKLEETLCLTLLPNDEIQSEINRLKIISELITHDGKEFRNVDKKWIKYLLYQASRYFSLNDLTYLLALYSPYQIVKIFMDND